MKFKIILASIALLLLAGCAAAVPAATPEVTPQNPYDGLPDAARTYLAQVGRYDSLDVIVIARDRSASDLEVVLSNVQMIVPPPELEQAHEELVTGYRFTLEGRQMLESATGDNEGRAEAYFLLDWGFRHLWEHGQMVSRYVTNAGSGASGGESASG